MILHKNGITLIIKIELLKFVNADLNELVIDTLLSLG